MVQCNVSATVEMIWVLMKWKRFAMMSSGLWAHCPHHQIQIQIQISLVIKVLQMWHYPHCCCAPLIQLLLLCFTPLLWLNWLEYLKQWWMIPRGALICAPKARSVHCLDTSNGFAVDPMPISIFAIHWLPKEELHWRAIVDSLPHFPNRVLVLEWRAHCDSANFWLCLLLNYPICVCFWFIHSNIQFDWHHRLKRVQNSTPIGNDDSQKASSSYVFKRKGESFSVRGVVFKRRVKPAMAEALLGRSSESVFFTRRITFEGPFSVGKAKEGALSIQNLEDENLNGTLIDCCAHAALLWLLKWIQL